MVPFAEEGSIPRTPIDLFIDKHRSLYDSGRRPEGAATSITYWLPLEETNDQPQNVSYYENKITKAARRVKTVFGDLPPSLTYLFITTTDQWNELNDISHGKLHKMHGDRLKGRAGRREIVAFTRRGLRSETNILDDSQVPVSYEGDESTYLDHSLQQLLEHETAHTQRIEMGIQIPAWYDEGLCTIITPLPRSARNMQTESRITQALSTFTEPPSPAQLDTANIQNIFGIYYLNWLLQNCTHDLPLQKHESPDSFKYSDERLHILVKVLEKMKSGNNFDEAFQEIFGLSHEEGYKRFKDSLQ